MLGAAQETAGEPRDVASQSPLGALAGSSSRRRGFGVLLSWLVELPLLGDGLARITRAPIKIRPLSTRVTRIHASMLRLAGGRLRRSWVFAAGQPVLALTTTGRKTGLPRSTAVACFTHLDDLVIAGMNLGLSHHPYWALNLQADPHATIEIGGHRIPVAAREATGEEATELWRRWLALQPSADAFQRIAHRNIPLFVLTRRS